MSVRASTVYVVAKHSQFQKHVLDRKDARAIELLARHDPVVARWKRADARHRRTLDAVLSRLEKLGASTKIVTSLNMRFSPRDAALVLSVGGDGTLLSASHNIGAEPLLGVNSSPEHSVGYFCAARPENLSVMISLSLEGRLKAQALTRMSVYVNDRLRSSRVLNEVLYSHRIPAAVSRYILEYRGKAEEQRSSGFWIGTAAGSTGALHSAGGRKMPLQSSQLQLVVREPYTPPGMAIAMRRLTVPKGQALYARTKMDQAVLFLDGPYRRIHVGLGDVVRFEGSPEHLNVLGIGKQHSGRG
jgi:NAD+ kinase